MLFFGTYIFAVLYELNGFFYAAFCKEDNDILTFELKCAFSNSDILFLPIFLNQFNFKDVDLSDLFSDAVIIGVLILAVCNIAITVVNYSSMLTALPLWMMIALESACWCFVALIAVVAYAVIRKHIKK